VRNNTALLTGTGKAFEIDEVELAPPGTEKC
jgi:hypothetical protein